MTSTLERILEEVRSLTPSEQMKLREALDEAETRRLALVDELCGKYPELTPTEQFMREKHEENERQERRRGW
jgi:hypothetical protein